jgi:cytidyltransferase-like protein
MNRDGLISGLAGRPGLRLGIMGGAFDPIHIAHLVTAEEALVQFDLHQVLFMPAGDHPQKSREMAPAEFRYLLTAVATASNPRFSVSRHEISGERVSYTVDTLEYLAGILPAGTEMFFVTGADAVLDILRGRIPLGFSNCQPSSRPLARDMISPAGRITSGTRFAGNRCCSGSSSQDHGGTGAGDLLQHDQGEIGEVRRFAIWFPSRGSTHREERPLRRCRNDLHQPVCGFSVSGEQTRRPRRGHGPSERGRFVWLLGDGR